MARINTDKAISIPLTKINDYLLSCPLSEKIGLADGMSGIAAYCLLSGIHHDNEALLQRSIDIISAIFDATEGKSIDYTYSEGLAGIFAILQIFWKYDLIEEDPSALMEHFDAAIYTLALQDMEKGNFSLWTGGTGAVVYFLHKPIRDQGTSVVLTELITALDRAVTPSEEGLGWAIQPDPDSGYHAPVFDLGLFHGNIGILLVLCRARKFGIEHDALEPMIRRTVDFILAQQYPSGFGSCFPGSVSADSEILAGSILSLAYGDICVGYALLVAAETLSDQTIQQKAMQILRSTLHKTTHELDYVPDASLMRGIAGIMILYRKVFEMTQDDTFLSNHIFWKNALLGSYCEGKGTAGFVFADRDADVHKGLMNGIAGVGLALLSLENSEYESWIPGIYL